MRGGVLGMGLRKGGRRLERFGGMVCVHTYDGRFKWLLGCGT